MKIRILALSLLSTLTLAAYSQEVQQQVEMADGMRQSGKIYVVVAVLSLVFLGISTYLVSIDMKLSKLEKKIKEKNK
jgi:hypothetical protein